MRNGKKDKTVTFPLSIWWNPKDEAIHLASKESEAFIATVNGDPKSLRGHPKLFRELAKILRRNGVPAPNPVRANQSKPEERNAVTQAGMPDIDFSPIEIRGEPLSATVIRERR